MTTIPPTDTRTRWYYADANNQRISRITVEMFQPLCQNGTVTAIVNAGWGDTVNG